MGIRKSTQIKYWAIFEAYLKKKPLHEIQSQFDCDRATVFRAVKYCRENRLELSKPEQIDIAIAAKEMRLRMMYARLTFYQDGWDETSIQQIRDGPQIFKRVRRKFSPTAEIGLLKEIRELEKDIEELQGLRDFKLQLEHSGEITHKGYSLVSPDDWPDGEDDSDSG